jgi:cobalt-zinc-cadmium efflux system outer membrane protein
MLLPRSVLLGCFLLVGCHAPRLEIIDQSVAALAFRPYDVAPALLPEAPTVQPEEPKSRPGEKPKQEVADPQRQGATDLKPVGFSQVQPAVQVSPILEKYQLKIPTPVPGSETPLIKLPDNAAEREKAVDRLYGLPDLPKEPVPLPGPHGQAYTLADLQQIAALNSPQLRQAAANVEVARGNLDQARTYPNPTVGIEQGPNNNNTGSGTVGGYYDQVIKTCGKLRLQAAAAEMDLRNAELALVRARSDLATQVRTAYYALLVAQETVRVNKALTQFTDDIFRLQADLLRAGQAASHEPAALLAQSFTVRLAYRQAILNYAYAWKQLVAALGVPQMPLSAVEGRVDKLIPYFDYDAVLAHVLKNHTDILTARNTVEKARYTLKLAQVTPWPDVEVRADLQKDFQGGKTVFQNISVIVPLPIWDQNRGNIRAASAGLVNASEEPHRVEVTIVGNLAAAYANYQTNLAAVEDYRKYILPNQVRYYRGVFERRKIDINASFGDLVQAQQTLAANVSTYLGLLGSLWPAVVTVADFLQTDDLYQLGKPLPVPELPDLAALHAWTCPHPIPGGTAPCPQPQPIGQLQPVPAQGPVLQPQPGALPATLPATLPTTLPPPGNTPSAFGSASEPRPTDPGAGSREQRSQATPAPATPAAVSGSSNVPAPRELTPTAPQNPDAPRR